ncbi:MAG: hypothetical protein HY332_19475 [Chloroflexi bacterium]|nr:hypothetical protein [Chloroflexota bacterium]
MLTMEVPRGVDGQPVLPEATWEATPAAAQAVFAALAQQVVALAAEVGDLKVRLGQNSTNSSRLEPATLGLDFRSHALIAQTKNRDRLR